MTVEILKVIIALCAINSIEDNKSDWMEFKKMQKLQRECRVYYYNCFEEKKKGSMAIFERHIIECDEEKK